MTHKAALDWVNDENGWISTPLGLEINLRSHVDPFGELVDLEAAASWSPRDISKPSMAPLAVFRHNETITTGSTLVIEANTRTKKGAVPVLFLTPKIQTFWEAKIRTTTKRETKAGAITAREYLVHPAFLRKLADEVGVLAKHPTHLSIPPLPGTLLEKMGMQFPADTQIRYMDSDSKVWLMHNAKGHAQFQAIIDDLGLAIQDRPAE